MTIVAKEIKENLSLISYNEKGETEIYIEHHAGDIIRMKNMYFLVAADDYYLPTYIHLGEFEAVHSLNDLINLSGEKICTIYRDIIRIYF